MSEKIALLPIFPSIPIEVVCQFCILSIRYPHKGFNQSMIWQRLQIKGCLEPPIEGVAIMTYGSGDLPESRADMITAIRCAVQRGVVIVTCCPCRGGPHDVSMQYIKQVHCTAFCLNFVKTRTGCSST